MKLVGRCMDETIRKNLYLFADFSYRYIPNFEIPSIHEKIEEYSPSPYIFCRLVIEKKLTRMFELHMSRN